MLQKYSAFFSIWLSYNLIFVIYFQHCLIYFMNTCPESICFYIKAISYASKINSILLYLLVSEGFNFNSISDLRHFSSISKCEYAVVLALVLFLRRKVTYVVFQHIGWLQNGLEFRSVVLLWYRNTAWVSFISLCT